MDPRFSGMSEEAIYQQLAQNSGGGGGGGQGQAVAGSGGSSGQPSGRKGQSGQGASGNTPQNGSPPPFGEFTPQPATDQQAKQDKTQWENTLLQSIAASKGRGDVPGMLDRFVEELMNPKVPWTELVKNWLREKAEDDWDWTKPNPYFDDGDFILPSLHSERMGTAVFATDTSGSIDQTVLAKFQAEKQGFLDEMKPTKLVDICCDTRITQEKEYRVGDQIDTNCPGGGGTRFEPVFEHIEGFTDKPKFAVYLTDLDGSFPAQEPDYPVLWVVYGCGDKKAPFGDTIQAE
jgi:predicted metal-dependent peptidase